MKRYLYIISCIALLCVPVFASVQCDGVDDLLTQALTLDTFLNADAFTIVARVAGSGSIFTSDVCWNAGQFVSDTLGVIAFGRSGTTGTGSACAYTYSGADHNILSPIWSGVFQVVMRLSGGTLTLFVGGWPVASTGAGNLADLGGALQLCGGGDDFSPDRLLDIVVYDTALSDTVIQHLDGNRLQYVPRGSPTGYWPLTDCAHGASGHGVSFKDRSGNNRHFTGAQGANGAGLTCFGTSFLSRPWGIQ